jgi:hypothetical protein
MERTQDGGFSGSRRLSVIDRIDKHRDPENVRQENKFLPLSVADLAGSGEKVNCSHPFRCSWLDFFDNGMEMGDDGRNQLFEAGVPSA